MDIMIDIETLGTRTDCPVISIGAVAFDLNKIYDKFYIALDVKDQIDSGKRKVDADTIKWWMSQGDAAKKVFKENFKDNSVGLSEFAYWIITFKGEKYVWGNGATFDISILESLMYDYGIDIPWKYNKIMDQRTIKRFLGKDIEMVRKGTYHNAIDDALTQAEYIQSCLRRYHELKSGTLTK